MEATEVEVKSDGGCSVSIRVAADGTGTYGGFMYVTDEQATEIVRQLMVQGYGVRAAEAERDNLRAELAAAYRELDRARHPQPGDYDDGPDNWEDTK